MAIFVMTLTSDGCPASCYEYQDRGDGNPPWAFHGYVRMAATNAVDAEQELIAARDEFWRGQAAEDLRRDVRRWMRENAAHFTSATKLAEAASAGFLPDYSRLDDEINWVLDEAQKAINAR